MDAVGVIQRLLDWALGWRRKRLLRARDAPELPGVLVPGTIYFVGENGYQWAAAFRCPCGCRETIQLNLLPKRRPQWSVNLDKNKAVSLSPSVWRKVGCCSHFVVSHGHIHWCERR